MKKNWIALIVLLVLVGFTLYTNLNKPKLPSEVKPLPGYLAPDFTLMDLEGRPVTLSELEGKPVYINFWASWCGPCKIEMPYLQAAYEEYKDKIHFVMINQTAGDDYEKMVSYINSNEFTFPVYLDEKMDVSIIYQALSIPMSYFIDHNGVVTEKVLGAMDESRIDHLMRTLVK